jgi:hypothetical protein
MPLNNLHLKIYSIYLITDLPKATLFYETLNNNKHLQSITFTIAGILTFPHLRLLAEYHLPNLESYTVVEDSGAYDGNVVDPIHLLAPKLKQVYLSTGHLYHLDTRNLQSITDLTLISNTMCMDDYLQVLQNSPNIVTCQIMFHTYTFTNLVNDIPIITLQHLRTLYLFTNEKTSTLLSKIQAPEIVSIIIVKLKHAHKDTKIKSIIPFIYHTKKLSDLTIIGEYPNQEKKDFNQEFNNLHPNALCCWYKDLEFSTDDPIEN